MVVVKGPNSNDIGDKFPVGMRVLAVDDDPSSLWYLETLLQQCRYHVTVTPDAISALRLLTENKSKFDLIISDVHMPGMDGFNLLQVVQLYEDLPVILLSEDDDPKMVVKGIELGACHYLKKPVRIDELKNIYQHVIRKKNIDSKKHAKDDYNNYKCHNKEDSSTSTQKKPRISWTIELQRNFEAAVEQIGIDKAVPKKILELMNVGKQLTRHQVASHLQKYKLSLKSISSKATQQVAYLQSGNQSSIINTSEKTNFQGWDEQNQNDNYPSHRIPVNGVGGHSPLNSTYDGCWDFDSCNCGNCLYAEESAEETEPIFHTSGVCTSFIQNQSCVFK